MRSTTSRKDTGALDPFAGENYSSDELDLEGDTNLATELDEEVDDVLMAEKDSGASCKLSEVSALIFGGVSSRFWMMRKHIASLDKNSLGKLPFQSWQCLTLQLKHRDIDLVVRDPNMMELLLKFLIYQLKTQDGARNSALPLLKAANEQVDRRASFIRQVQV